jgi:hypothetical protein
MNDERRFSEYLSESLIFQLRAVNQLSVALLFLEESDPRFARLRGLLAQAHAIEEVLDEINSAG